MPQPSRRPAIVGWVVIRLVIPRKGEVVHAAEVYPTNCRMSPGFRFSIHLITPVSWKYVSLSTDEGTVAGKCRIAATVVQTTARLFIGSGREVRSLRSNTRAPITTLEPPLNIRAAEDQMPCAERLFKG